MTTTEQSPTPLIDAELQQRIDHLRTTCMHPANDEAFDVWVARYRVRTAAPQVNDWNERLEAERIAVHATIYDNERHYPSEYSDALAEGPLTPAETGELEAYRERCLGDVAIREKRAYALGNLTQLW